MNMWKQTTSLVLFLLILKENAAAKILAVFPTPAVSHQSVFRPLTHELVRRGHEVVLITSYPSFPDGQAPKNLKEIDVHEIYHKGWQKVVDVIRSNMKGLNSDDLHNFKRRHVELFEKSMQVEAVQDIIKNQRESFDLVLIESWLRYTLGFSHVIKAPVIQVSSLGVVGYEYQTIGASTHPLVYPFELNTRIYNLTFLEQIEEFYVYNWYFYQTSRNEEHEHVVLKRIFGEDLPPLSSMRNNVNMIFLNIHRLWDDNRPVPAGVVYMGGMNKKLRKELPVDLKSYLDSSKNGVIYISFGTTVDAAQLPAAKIEAIIKAVSQLPYDVLWKWNHNELPGKTENIRISKWLPQSDLLRHPNIKLFITQGGLQSTDEAIIAGVPLIGIPVAGDQWYNVEKYVHHKIGMQVNLLDLNEDALKQAIMTVIHDKSYRDNIVRLRTLIYDQPMSSLERAVWWTEHVLRHGGARHLRAPAANMSIAEYYELELVLVVLCALILLLALTVIIVFRVYKYIVRKIRNCRYDIKIN